MLQMGISESAAVDTWSSSVTVFAEPGIVLALLHQFFAAHASICGTVTEAGACR